MTSAHQAVRPCPLCGGTGAVLLTRLSYAVFDDCPLEPSFAWVNCAACGFSYYDTPSTALSFDAYYQGNAYYCSAATAGSGGNSPAERKRFDAMAALIACHLPDREAAIFDIGCGKGGLLASLKAMSYSRLHGIDLLSANIEYLQKTYGVAAAIGSAERLSFEGVRPSLLVYSHILEHLLQPRAVLDEAWNRLAVGGLVYVEVPDASRYGTFSSLPWTELYLEDINHLDIAHLEALMISSGYETVETGSSAIVADGVIPAPCIYGVFRKAPVRGQSAPSIRATTIGVEAYVARCNKAALLGRLEQVAASGTPLYIWGMSQYAQLLLGQTALARCSIKALLDGDAHKRSKTIGGRPILPPAALAYAQPLDAILLTGINYREQMRRYLQEIGFKGREIVIE